MQYGVAVWRVAVSAQRAVVMIEADSPEQAQRRMDAMTDAELDVQISTTGQLAESLLGDTAYPNPSLWESAGLVFDEQNVGHRV